MSVRDDIKSSGKLAIFSYHFSVGEGTEVPSSVQTHPLGIYKEQGVQTLFFISVAFQVRLGNLDINIFNGFDI